MLERKGIEHKLVNILPGSQPVVVRLVGFRGITVPALRIDGRRIQGSPEISRFLDELVPEPPLFPRDPEQRRASRGGRALGGGDASTGSPPHFPLGRRQAPVREALDRGRRGRPAAAGPRGVRQRTGGAQAGNHGRRATTPSAATWQRCRI
jgi:glutathione S-transferase